MPRSPVPRLRVPRVGRAALVGFVALLPLAACEEPRPKHRERAPTRDGECKDATRPHAFFYPAANRTDYHPDHPQKDGCELLLADHLFCCPNAPRTTDR